MPDWEFDNAAFDLIDAVRELFEREAENDAADAAQLQRALRLMTQLRPAADADPPAGLPVCRHLDRLKGAMAHP